MTIDLDLRILFFIYQIHEQECISIIMNDLVHFHLNCVIKQIFIVTFEARTGLVPIILYVTMIYQWLGSS